MPENSNKMPQNHAPNAFYPIQSDMSSHQIPQHDTEAFQSPWMDNIAPENISMDAEMFKTMSSLEPLSARVGAIHEDIQRMS